MAARKKEIDFDQLNKLLNLQCTEEECASFFSISKNTLKARIREAGHESFLSYAEPHRAMGKISLRRHQWRSAEKGVWQMQKFLGTQWLGQSDKVEAKTEITSHAGAGLEEKQTEAVKTWAKQIQNRVRQKRN
tara:strand:+ start:509 stop:907 length:399 start_codon:yes stop_codon:yes gene_type:complete